MTWPCSLALPKAVRQSTSDFVAETLREAIVSGQLASGVLLKQDELAERFHVSKIRCARRSSASRPRAWSASCATRARSWPRCRPTRSGNTSRSAPCWRRARRRAGRAAHHRGQPAAGQAGARSLRQRAQPGSLGRGQLAAALGALPRRPPSGADGRDPFPLRQVERYVRALLSVTPNCRRPSASIKPSLKRSLPGMRRGRQP